MTEFVPQHGLSNRGYQIESGPVRRDAYRILASIFAAGKFNTHITGSAVDPIGNLCSENEYIEIERALINTAISLRIILDRENIDTRSSEMSCGEIILNIDNNDDSVNLSFREACNKIIHANNINFDVDDVNDPQSINPILYIYGSRNGQNWKAVLDVVKYVTVLGAITQYA